MSKTKSTGKKRKGKGQSQPEPLIAQPSTSTEPPQPQPKVRLRGDIEHSNSPAPVGLTLRRVLRGHRAWIGRMAWSPDGRKLASPSQDKTIRIWDLETGECLAVLEGHMRAVNSVAWSPDGQMIASASLDNTIRLWDLNREKPLRTLKVNNPLQEVAWLPEGTIVSGGFDKDVLFWDAQTGERLYKGPETNTVSMALAPDGRTLAIAPSNGKLILWDTEAQSLIRKMGWSSYYFSLVWTPDQKNLISGSDEGLILWDVESGRQTLELEGHTKAVVNISLSFDGNLLASKSTDGTVRIWQRGTWETVAILPEPTSAAWGQSIAFHPSLPVLATLGEAETVIRLWDLDMDLLLSGQAVTEEAVHYTTAKLVLVGDSGVGKTGLGWRLAHGKYKEQSSTHGQQFWVINELTTKRNDGTECEAVLWDLAGQHVYRSVHAIFLDDVDMSLVLFDPTNRQEPMKGAEFWLEQLAGKEKLPPTVLVGARVDRGAPVSSREEFEQFCQRYGISGGYVSTSAMTGEGLDQLLDILKTQIPWEQMMATVTTVTFKRIKEYVLKLKEKPDRRGVLVRPAELRGQLQAEDAKWEFTDAEMMKAVKHLETHGYVALLRSSSGEESILLKPELLVDLASSIVLQADKHPRELGALSETELLQGSYPFQELVNLEEEEQQVLLDAAVARFLSHHICFRDALGAEALLIFPGLIKQKRPLLDEVEAIEDVSYIVRGRVENVYEALVVLLGYTQTFTRVNQWQNQAQYELGKGEICGFRMIEEREGEIELVLYYSTEMPAYGCRMFQGLFEQFLYQRDVTVTRFPPVVCPNEHRQERATVVKRLRENKSFLFCEECGERITLPEVEKALALGVTDARRIQRDEALARLRGLYETHLARVKSYRRDRAAPRCYLSHMPEQASWAAHLTRDLRDAGALMLEDTEQVQENDSLIPICTPAYKRMWERSDKFLTAAASLIRTRLNQDATQWPTVVPLWLEGAASAAYPVELRDRLAGDFRDDTRYAVSLFDLVLTLYKIPLNHPAFEPLRNSLQKQWALTLSRLPEVHAQDEMVLDQEKGKSSALKIFISYAHKDEKFKDELVGMLAGLQRRKIIDAWQDRRIEAGDEWYQSIKQSMNECQLALLLVSRDFIASPFIQDEELPGLLRRRQEEGLQVIPIIVRECLWQSESVLRGLQALPLNGKPVITFRKETGKRDKVWAEIAQVIESRAKSFAEESPE